MAVRRLAPLLVVALLALVPATVRSVAAGAATAPAAVGEGRVVGFGEALPVSSTAPVLDDLVSVASTPSGLGWWAVSRDGRVVGAGDAAVRGDATARVDVVAITAAPTTSGYRIASADGGVFTFGGASFAGSAGDIALRAPIVGMAATPSGRGYWLVASDGGVFTFGDATFRGSAGAIPLRSPVVGMAATPSGRGYWLVAGDGGVFSYGDAAFHGAGRDGTTAIAPTPQGGYRLLSADGAVVGRGPGTSPTRGDLAGRVPDAAAVSITPTAGANSGGYRIGVGAVRDVLTIWQPGGLGAAAEAWARDVAARAGGRTALRHRTNLDIPAPGGWRIPLTLTTVEPATAAPLVGPTAAAALGRREAVLGRRAAALRNARVGGSIDVLAPDGAVQTRRIGAIVDDRRLAWSELALATADAASIGVNRPFAIDVWGASRQDVEQALATSPPQPTRLGIERSWVPASPDETLPSVELKRVAGEVAYRPGGGDAVALDPAWVSANIVSEPVPGLGRVTCLRAMLPALRGALTEVVQAGLAGALGRYGGCYNARLIRGGDSGGILSRHSYGIAVDVNITRNTFGGRVELDGRVVEIFRRWGFAWGGTWVRPDGMHLEWAPR